MSEIFERNYDNMRRSELKNFIKKFVEECYEDMRDAKKMIEGKSKLELSQVEAELKSEIEQLNSWESVLEFLTFTMTLFSIIIKAGEISWAILLVLFTLFIVFALAVLSSLKKGKYVRALEYLNALEKRNELPDVE